MGFDLSQVEQIKQKASESIESSKNLSDIEACRVQFLGKNSLLTQALKELGSLPPEQKRVLGKSLNTLKSHIQSLIQDKKKHFSDGVDHASIFPSGADVTMPSAFFPQGSWHPISLTLSRVQNILSRIGFSFVPGNEVETDYYNFEALNIAKDHPARGMHDTFYFSESLLLRTHTSSTQVHVMEASSPPFAVFSSGKVYRCDSDITHTPMFHQVEGLMIDDEVNFAQLKGLLIYFLEAFFERSLDVRFRASYFPFTEPSAEVDVACVSCSGKGCQVCGRTGWLEVLGCGIVNQRVLEKSNINPKMFQGIAFGMGIERLAMLRYSMGDLRVFFENDVRFLSNFTGVALGA